MKQAPQASFRVQGSRLAPWAGFSAGMKPTPPDDFYAANCFCIAAWKWNVVAFLSRAASF